MDHIKQFHNERQENIDRQGKDVDAKQKAMDFMLATAEYKYTYSFSWMGVPIIQFPQDMIAMQELIWEIKPDLIIETGIAHGGSILFYASLLELQGGDGEVLGIDIDIREHNRKAIEAHPMYKRVKMIEGSSIDLSTIEKIKTVAAGKKRILVSLDSNHTHDHVLDELKLYSGFVSKGSYLVVFDTLVEDVPDEYQNPDRPWGKGNNPKTAVKEFLKDNDDFVIDKNIDNKLLISVAPDGYLKRVK